MRARLTNPTITQLLITLSRTRDLAVRRSTGGKGKTRLPEPVEEIIRDLIRKRFLTRQKRSVAALDREISRAYAAQGLKVPTRNTVAHRIATPNLKYPQAGRQSGQLNTKWSFWS
jgi:hypothetical protein